MICGKNNHQNFSHLATCFHYQPRLDFAPKRHLTRIIGTMFKRFLGDQVVWTWNMSNKILWSHQLGNNLKKNLSITTQLIKKEKVSLFPHQRNNIISIRHLFSSWRGSWISGYFIVNLKFRKKWKNYLIVFHSWKSNTGWIRKYYVLCKCWNGLSS